MKYTLLPVFVFFCMCATAQNKAQAPGSDKPIENIYHEWSSRWKYDRITCDTLYYTEDINIAIIDSTINRIAVSNSFNIHSLYRSSNSAPLTLTKEEQQYILKELEKLKAHKWEAGLFPNSKRIAQADIEAVLARTEALKTAKEKNMCSIIYTFSKPIFIRNNTICLYLDQERYRTNYTQLEFNFYITENNRWERYARVYMHYEQKQ